MMELWHRALTTMAAAWQAHRMTLTRWLFVAQPTRTATAADVYQSSVVGCQPQPLLHTLVLAAAMVLVCSTPSLATPPAWSASAVYVGGDQVCHGSNEYTAKWWTQGEEPGTTGQWGVWDDMGPTAACSGGGDVSPPPSDGPLPATPWIAWLPAETVEPSLEVAWNMWWGENGTSWSLSHNGAKHCKGNLVANSPQPQASSCTVPLVSGVNDFVVDLCRGTICASSPTVTVKYTGVAALEPADLAPANPLMSHAAPFVDATAWPTFPMTTVAQDTDVDNYVLGFIVAASHTTCEATWGTYYHMADNYLMEDIHALRNLGGDVVVSFGGAANTPLASACTSVSDLVTAYRSVVERYKLNKIDFDIEGIWVADALSNARRSQAIAQLQSELPDLKVWYTLPVLPSGLTADGVRTLQQALAAGVEIYGVNIMAMDYGDSAAPNPGGHMGQYAIQAAQALFQQLQSLYPDRSEAQLWAMVGITPMIGMNDITSEIFRLADAQEVLAFAQQNHIGLLSLWSANRDHECPGGAANYVSITCSSILQTDYEFSMLFDQFAASHD